MAQSKPRSPAKGYDFKAERAALNCRFEIEFVTRILLEAKGNVAAAADLGGIDRVTLHRLVRKHKLTGLTKRYLRWNETAALLKARP